MANRVCGLGFDCAAMMQLPGIDPGDCLNYRRCGAATRLTDDEEFELVRVRVEGWQRWLEQGARFREDELERLQLTRRHAAAAMLNRRGYPQTPESLGLAALVEHMSSQVAQLQEALRQVQQQYVAPEGSEIHSYSVKRPSRAELRHRRVPEDQIRQHQRVFNYHKLMASREQFAPVTGWRFNHQRREWEECSHVRAIHLGHDDDARRREAMAGLQRRNAMMRLRTALANAVASLEAALTAYEEDMPEGLPPRPLFSSQMSGPQASNDPLLWPPPPPSTEGSG
jgi:hypothetical protein